MSVIIAAHVHEGIVLASDTRTTVKDGNGNTMYKDDAVKIVPFPNRMAVAHCGDASLTKSLTVNEFLYQCRNRFGKECRVFDLPMKLLYEYQKLNVNADTTFYIAGYVYLGINACVYKVLTKDGTITLEWSDFKCGASFGGMISVPYAMMKDADYNNMSLRGCERIVSESVKSTILSFQYQNPQSVGGHCNMYVISADGTRVGWVKESGLEKDVSAPDDAYERLMAEKVDSFMERATKNDKES